MDVTTFITRLLRACLIAALVLSPGMIKHAGATPITSTTIEDLVRPDRSGNPGYQTLFQSAPDRYEFLLWTPDLTTSAGASFTPTFFPVTQVPQYPESSHDSGSFRGFSAGLPSAIQTLSVKITPIADVDITKSLLGNGESFPMLAYDEAFVPSARHHLLPDIAIPEPSTLVLLTTALSGMYAYGFWRRRKHAAAQSSSETMTAEVMHDVKDALTAIQTCAEVLGYDDLDPHDRQEFTRKIAGQVEQCITVIEEFLGNSPDRSGNSGCQRPCQVLEDHLQTVEEPPMTRAMSVLLLDTEKAWVEEVQAAFQNLPITIYVADSQQQARRILASHPITIVIFALRILTDLEFLHELNTTYRQIEVILTVEHPVSEIVTILKEGTYRIMEAPLMPSALRAYIETINPERKYHSQGQ